MNKHLITIVAAIAALLAVRHAHANPYAYGTYYNGLPQAAVTHAYNTQVNAYNAYTNVYQNYQPYGPCYAPQYNVGYQRYYNRPEIEINIKNKTVYNNITQNNIYNRHDRLNNGWRAPWRPRYSQRDFRKRTRETHEYREKHTYETDTRRRGGRRNYRFDW